MSVQLDCDLLKEILLHNVHDYSNKHHRKYLDFSGSKFLLLNRSAFSVFWSSFYASTREFENLEYAYFDSVYASHSVVYKQFQELSFYLTGMVKEIPSFWSRRFNDRLQISETFLKLLLFKDVIKSVKVFRINSSSKCADLLADVLKKTRIGQIEAIVFHSDNTHVEFRALADFVQRYPNISVIGQSLDIFSHISGYNRLKAFEFVGDKDEVYTRGSLDKVRNVQKLTLETKTSANMLIHLRELDVDELVLKSKYIVKGATTVEFYDSVNRSDKLTFEHRVYQLNNKVASDISLCLCRAFSNIQAYNVRILRLSRTMAEKIFLKCCSIEIEAQIYLKANTERQCTKLVEDLFALCQGLSNVVIEEWQFGKYGSKFISKRTIEPGYECQLEGGCSSVTEVNYKVSCCYNDERTIVFKVIVFFREPEDSCNRKTKKGL